MYIDESYDTNAPYIALAGVIVPDDKWHYVNRSLNNLKRSYFGDDKFNLKAIRRNKYDEEGRWSKLTPQEKLHFNVLFHSILNNGIVLMVSLIDKSKMNKKDKADLFKLAYSFLVQRFEYHLSSSSDSYGSVIVDEADTSQEVRKLWNAHREIMELGVITKGTTTTNNPDGTISISFNTPTRLPITRIIDNLTFQRDDFSNYLQIADLVASAFSVEYNRNIGKFSSPYKSLLRHKKDGTVLGYGLKIFPL